MTDTTTMNGTHTSDRGGAATVPTNGLEPPRHGSAAMLDEERIEAEEALAAATARYDQRLSAWKANIAKIATEERSIAAAKTRLDAARDENKTLSSLLAAAKARMEGQQEALTKLQSDTVRIRPPARKGATK